MLLTVSSTPLFLINNEYPHRIVNGCGWIAQKAYIKKKIVEGM